MKKLCTLGVIGIAMFTSRTDSTATTFQELAGNNLLPNASFESGAQGKGVRAWSVHPEGTELIRSVETSDGSMLEMLPGANSLAVISRGIPVEEGVAYTLAVDLKQESIYMGFGMGMRAIFVWEVENDGRRPEIMETIDGSFDWETVSYSVIAPAGATSVRIRLIKRGSPGTIFFRNAVFAPGTLFKDKKDFTDLDFLRNAEAMDFIAVRMADFLADKSEVDFPADLRSKKQDLLREAKSLSVQVRADARELGVELGDEKRDQVVWAEMIKGALGFGVAPSSPYYSKWNELRAGFEGFRAAVEDWIGRENHARLAQEMNAAFGGFSGYALGVDSQMLKVRKDAAYMGNVRAEASIALARNEEEGIQVTLSALDAPLKDVSVVPGKFESADNQVLPKELISVHRIDFVKTMPPQYYAEPVGWWPDVVWPESSVAEIAKGTNQSFWITVAADASTVPGDYRGKIKILSGEKLLNEIELSVRVWDLTLPKPGKFEVLGCFHPYMLKNFYRWDTIREDVVAEWVRFILQKRWNPTLYFSGQMNPSGELLKAAVDEGINAVNLLDPSRYLDRDESRTYSWPTPEQEKAIREAVRKSLEEFKAAGGSEETTLYLTGFDEQHDRAQYKLMRHVFNLAKEEAPQAKTLTTTTYPPLDELVGAVDIWTPLLGKNDPDLRARQEAGDRMFFYVYAHPYRPFPNPSIIDYPGVDSRMTFWLASRMGYSGFLHYLFNGWKMNNDLEGPRWPETDWIPYSSVNQKSRNGAGYFLYPGLDGKPVASVRMELVRDGIEDWELIQMLKEELQQAEEKGVEAPLLEHARKALQAAEVMTPGLTEYSNDMEQLLTVRTEIAEALMGLQKAQN